MRLGAIGIFLLLAACSSAGSTPSNDRVPPPDVDSGGSSGGGSSGGSSGGGASDAGTAGDGAATGPVVMPGLSKVGTGEYETLYLVDGVIYGYGGGSNLLGQGTYEGVCIPPRSIDTPAGLKFVDVQGGLHQSMAIDQNGRVWTWGQPSSGLQGGGTDGGTGDGSVPYMVTADASGALFDGVIAIEPTSSFDAALKSDGTVWVWGDCTGGVTGDGTASGIVERPTKVPLPLASGVKVTKIVGSSQMYALASDGTVWAWGSAETNVIGTGMTGTTDVYTPRPVVSLPKDIVDIAVGYASFSYALTAEGELYGWGYRGAYLGLGDASNEYVPTPTPISLATVLNLPHPVVAVAADFMTTHVILSDGTLWGWGDDAMGMVGDGQELDFSKTATPYAWDWGSYELMVRTPVQIVPGVSNFTKIFTNSAYDFYDYAQTADGKLYSWGRNKTGTLGNGVYGVSANGNSGTSSNMEADYPNSWDVPLATLVDPMNVQPKGVNSPYCVNNPTATGCD